ncbi:hypothetical protein JEQ12_013126 [Ovis aries]|uniref:Uncharacterized protein n=1 Tax=Ovis aries TaxID=9940 RepID=A0A835ZN20_SHEEP|nr:hypothetical protein JEQ12_013126 [Ovis aries]
MNTVLSRANSLFAFSLSVMAALTFGCFITTAFKDRSVPVRLHVSRIMLLIHPTMRVGESDSSTTDWIIMGITNLDAYEQETGNEDGQVKYLAFFLNTGEKGKSSLQREQSNAIPSLHTESPLVHRAMCEKDAGFFYCKSVYTKPT